MSFRDVVASIEKDFDARRYLERFEYKEHGDNWSLECPVCGKKDKLWVLVGEKKDRPPGTWLCFYCDEAGTAFDLIGRLEGENVLRTIDILKEFSTDEGDTSSLADVVERAFRGLPEPSEPLAVDPCFLPESFTPVEVGKEAPSYLRERGISKREGQRRKIGWCSHGRYANRLIVPVYRGNQLRWFQGRWMASKPPSGVKKYLNSIASHASEDLYGIELLADKKRVVLVEDVFSAIHVGPGAVATFGTHFSQTQLSLLARTAANEIVVMWDPDALEKAYALAERLSEVWLVRVIVLPKGKDPDDLPREELRSLIAKSVPLGCGDVFRETVRAKLARF